MIWWLYYQVNRTNHLLNYSYLYFGNNGANDGDRTRDPRYHKPLLYQLSYDRHIVLFWPSQVSALFYKKRRTDCNAFCKKVLLLSYFTLKMILDLVVGIWLYQGGLMLMRADAISGKESSILRACCVLFPAICVFIFSLMPLVS